MRRKLLLMPWQRHEKELFWCDYFLGIMYLLCSFYLPWHFYSLRFYTCQEVLFADCRTSWNSEFHPQSLCYILPPTNTRFTRVCKQFVIAGSFVHNLPGNCLRGQQVCTQFLLLLCQNKQLLDVCHNFIALTVHLQSCIFCLALNLTMIAIQSICSSEIPLESFGKKIDKRVGIVKEPPSWLNKFTNFPSILVWELCMNGKLD